MGVVIAHRAVDFSQNRHGRRLVAGAFQAIGDIGHFLAERGRRGRLAVGARQHRLVGVAGGQVRDRRDQLVHARQQYAVAAVPEHQCVGKIIDVLGSAGEVDEFGAARDFLVAAGFFLQKIFDRLDVVIGGRLDLLDAARIAFREIRNDALEEFFRGWREGRYFLDLFVTAEREQPAYLDQHAPADQAVFAEERAERSGFGLVAAVER